MDPIDVFLEIGQKRTFAGAVDWPGWCRSGSGEALALQALLQYAPRYARALKGSGLAFEPPGILEGLRVVERVIGNATTDFGGINIPLAGDDLPLSESELQRLSAILGAGWADFLRAARQAAGRKLRKGPRGGGRDLEEIIEHIFGGEDAYLSMIGGPRPKRVAGMDLARRVEAFRRASLDGMAAMAAGKVPMTGPRGGRRWQARTYARRSAWHLLDHAWEIEDRVLEEVG